MGLDVLSWVLAVSPAAFKHAAAASHMMALPPRLEQLKHPVRIVNDADTALGTDLLGINPLTILH